MSATSQRHQRQRPGAAQWALAAGLLLASALATLQGAQGQPSYADCMKNPFASGCRGISAKRSGAPPGALAAAGPQAPEVEGELLLAQVLARALAAALAQEARPRPDWQCWAGPRHLRPAYCG